MIKILQLKKNAF